MMNGNLKYSMTYWILLSVVLIFLLLSCNNHCAIMEIMQNINAITIYYTKIILQDAGDYQYF